MKQWILTLLSIFSLSVFAEETENQWGISLHYLPVFALVDVTPSSGSTIKYSSHGISYMGLGFNYNDLNIQYSFELPEYLNSKSDNGTTQSILNLSQSWDLHRVQFYYGQFEGFNGKVSSGAVSLPNTSESIRTDLQLDESFISYSYALYPDGFSFKNLGNFRRGQKYTTESWNLVGVYHYAHFRGDTPVTDLNKTGPDSKTLIGVQTRSLSAGFGYSRVKALNDWKWFVDGSVAIGPEQQKLDYINVNQSRTGVAALFSILASAEYAYKMFDLGIKVNYFSSYTKTDNQKMWTQVFLPQLYLEKWF